MKSRDFRSRLAEAARFTATSGYEAGFGLYRDLQSDTDHWTPVFHGTNDSIDESIIDDWKMQNNLYTAIESGFFIFDLHFHPEASGPILFSQNDLTRVFPGYAPFEARPIVGVGQIGNDGSGYVGLLQQQFGGSVWSTGIMDELDSHFSQFASNYTPGSRPFPSFKGPVKSALLRFRQGRGEVQAAELENPKAVKRFAYFTDPEQSPVVARYRNLITGENGRFDYDQLH